MSASEWDKTYDWRALVCLYISHERFRRNPPIPIWLWRSVLYFRNIFAVFFDNAQHVHRCVHVWCVCASRVCSSRMPQWIICVATWFLAFRQNGSANFDVWANTQLLHCYRIGSSTKWLNRTCAEYCLSARRLAERREKQKWQNDRCCLYTVTH